MQLICAHVFAYGKSRFSHMVLKLASKTMENSVILSTCIKLPHGFKTFILSIFEWQFKTGLTVILSAQPTRSGLFSSSTGFKQYNDFLSLSVPSYTCSYRKIFFVESTDITNSNVFVCLRLYVLVNNFFYKFGPAKNY